MRPAQEPDGHIPSEGHADARNDPNLLRGVSVRCFRLHLLAFLSCWRNFVHSAYCMHFLLFNGYIYYLSLAAHALNYPQIANTILVLHVLLQCPPNTAEKVSTYKQRCQTFVCCGI